MSGVDRSTPGVPVAADQWIRDQLAPREGRALAYVGHLLDQVRALPKYASPEAVADMDRVVWFACFDSFWMGIRLLSEYFVRMPSRDRTARDLLGSWNPPDCGAARRLRDDHWLASSKHFTHLSTALIPDNADEISVVDQSAASLMRIVEDVDVVVNAFVTTYLASNNPAYATQARRLQRTESS